MTGITKDYLNLEELRYDIKGYGYARTHLFKALTDMELNERRATLEIVEAIQRCEIYEKEYNSMAVEMSKLTKAFMAVHVSKLIYDARNVVTNTKENPNNIYIQKLDQLREKIKGMEELLSTNLDLTTTTKNTIEVLNNTMEMISGEYSAMETLAAETLHRFSFVMSKDEFQIILHGVKGLDAPARIRRIYKRLLKAYEKYFHHKYLCIRSISDCVTSTFNNETVLNIYVVVESYKYKSAPEERLGGKNLELRLTSSMEKQYIKLKGEYYQTTWNGSLKHLERSDKPTKATRMIAFLEQYT